MPLPPRLAAALATLFSEPVDKVDIYEHARIMRLHGRAIATTRRRRIYLKGSAAHFFANPELLLHEFYHVLRQWETGRLTHWRYLAESLRRGYRRNRFEIEARAFAASHHEQLRTLAGR